MTCSGADALVWPLHLECQPDISAAACLVLIFSLGCPIVVAVITEQHLCVHRRVDELSTTKERRTAAKERRRKERPSKQAEREALGTCPLVKAPTTQPDSRSCIHPHSHFRSHTHTHHLPPLPTILHHSPLPTHSHPHPASYNHTHLRPPPTDPLGPGHAPAPAPCSYAAEPHVHIRWIFMSIQGGSSCPYKVDLHVHIR